MQRLFRRIPIIYFSYLLIMAAISIAFWSLGYTFIVTNDVIWFGINMFVALAFVLLHFVKRKEQTQSANNFTQALPIAMFIYFFALETLITGVRDGLLILHVLFCFLFCYLASLLSTTKKIIKIVCAVVNSFLLLWLLALSFFILTFGQIGENTTISRVTSPANSFTAVLIDSDQGALGGNTYVQVEDHNSEMNIGLGRLVKIRRVYVGRWGEFETMVLQWQDEQTLLINGQPYYMEHD